MENWKLINDGNILSPQGYKAGAKYVGIKSKKSEKPDMTIIVSEKEAASAGVFTTNKFAAAPVVYCREVLKYGKARAIVVNSGNANAATGSEGVEDARKLGATVAGELGLKTEEVFVCSTGVIGVHLPMEKMLNGIKEIVPLIGNTAEHGHLAERAIMTTDLVPKELALELELSGGKVVIGSMAKGSGMIHPNMATMLGYITTDADISSNLMQKMLKDAVDKSYNMLTVDGDTSTNDTLIMLANGVSGVKVESDADVKKFAAAVDYICTEMAKKVAADGEGATHLLIVEANNLPTLHDARLVARAVAASSLFKCAVFGKDANWGRVISAAGYSGAEFRTDLIDVVMKSKAGEIEVMHKGSGLNFDEEKAAKILAEDDITVVLDFHDGDSTATAYGCDLTYDYVKINGDYRS